MIPHSIFAALIAQPFSHGAARLHYPMTLGLALTLGGAMASPCRRSAPCR
jgi:hypothetical protein